MLRRPLLTLALLASTLCAQDSATLVLKSSPEGAAIYLNGENSQRSTPALLRVPIGEYDIALLKRDYVVTVHHCSLASEQTETIDSALVEDLEVPYQAQLRGVPDFVDGRREALEFFSSIIKLSTSYYVEEPAAVDLIKEATRALVEGIEGVRARESLLATVLSPVDLTEYYGESIGLDANGSLSLTVREWDDGSEQWTLKTDRATISRIFEAGADQTELLKNFGDFYAFLEEDYDRADLLSDDSLIDLALRGLIAELGDDHTRMIYPVALDDMQTKHEGEFGGLGITITVRDGALTVITPIDGTPAFRAGIEAGDTITHIDGEATAELSLQEAVSRMRGKPDTEVTVTIAREGAFDARDVTIVRAIIPLKFARSTILDGDIGYVRLTSFNSRRIATDLRADIAALRAEGARALILDLRNNPGGLLTQAHDVVDIFVDDGITVAVRGRIKDEVLRAKADDTIEDLPLAVLINEGSASASEIVAGAIQDYERGVVIGERSFGKGSVQMVLPVDPFDCAMALTIAKYFLPSGRTIHKHGVDPDTVIELSDEEQRAVARVSLYDQDWQPDDRQLDEALRVLREALRP